MRHRRAAEFDGALRGASVVVAGQRWADVAADPNAAAALAHRAATLGRAWRPPVGDRIAFLEDRCRGRRVLDIGCVAHDVARMRSPQWLHGRLAAAALRCTGVDVLEEGVAAARALGFHAVVHDLGQGLGPLEEELPYDVIVAGELFEHVTDTGMLFRVAAEALADGGELILTTPNPYAPHRVRAGQRGIVWENTDHILYAFPSGIAELAERHGLVLAEAMVTDDRRRGSVIELLKDVRRRVRGTRWVNVGYGTTGRVAVERVDSGAAARLARRTVFPGRRFLGETFLYVVRRPRS